MAYLVRGVMLVAWWALGGASITGLCGDGRGACRVDKTTAAPNGDSLWAIEWGESLNENRHNLLQAYVE